MAEGQSGQGHSQESPSSPVPDFDEDEQNLADYTILIEALDYPRSGDMNEFFAQDRAATSVKRFLYQAWSEEDPNLRKQQIKRNVKLLSECSQFLPFLRRILRSETIYVTLIQKGLWILSVIIAHGERSFVNQLEDYHLGNLLMHYMRSPHKTVSEQAVSTAAQVALAPSLRYQLLPCASVIFPTLVHILQQLKENPGSDPNLLRNVGELVSGMLIVPEEIHQKLQHAVASRDRNAEGEEERMEAFREYVDSHPELKKHMANLRMVQTAIPVMKLLLESGDKQIQCVMLHCVGVIPKFLITCKP